MALCIVCTYNSCRSHITRVLEYVGKYAAIMYLTHVLFIKIIPQIVYYPKYSVLVFAIFVVICLGAAIFVAWLEKVLRYDKLRLALVNRLNCLL